MAGIETGFSLGFTHNRLAIEISDTTGDGTNTNELYGHELYQSGYRHWGRNIGESAGTNAKKATLSGDHYFSFGHQLSWRIGQVKINETQTSNNFYSADRTQQDFAEMTYKIPLNQTAQLSGGAFYLKDDLQLREEFFRFSSKVTSGVYMQIELRF